MSPTCGRRDRAVHTAHTREGSSVDDVRDGARTTPQERGTHLGDEDGVDLGVEFEVLEDLHALPLRGGAVDVRSRRGGGERAQHTGPRGLQ